MILNSLCEIEKLGFLLLSIIPFSASHNYLILISAFNKSTDKSVIFEFVCVQAPFVGNLKRLFF